jgi:hypothetical protein
MERSMAFFILSPALVPSFIQNPAQRVLKKIFEKNEFL